MFLGVFGTRKLFLVRECVLLRLALRLPVVEWQLAPP